MPQINQLAEVAYSQFFWLLLVLAIIYFAIGRGMVPKVQSTIEARENRIAEDLATADRSRVAADEIEQSYRSRIEASRAEATKVTLAAKQASQREAEQRIRAADADVAARLGDAEAQIRTARDSALAGIDSVAAEAAQEMVAKLAGIEVSRDRAAEAVRAALRQSSGQPMSNG